MIPENSRSILALETAVQGGSISLLKGETEIDHRLGDSEVSRAEEILAAIEDILCVNKIERSDLDLIAVSVGPGSYTGIRIGLATALGLKNALNIETVGIPVLDAMTLTAARPGQIVSAVPIGKHDVCWRLFSGDLETGSDRDFLTFVQANSDFGFVVHGGLLKRLRDINETKGLDGLLYDAGMNLAYLIGLAALRLAGPHDLRPIFASVHQ